MFTVKGQAKTTGVKRIILIEDDDSETVINVSEKIHYIIAFAKVDEGEAGVTAEVLVKGDTAILGELYFQLGNDHPDLIKHCVRRSTEKIANAIIQEVKRSGVDPIGEALKKMEPGEKARWN